MKGRLSGAHALGALAIVAALAWYLPRGSNEALPTLPAQPVPDHSIDGLDDGYSHYVVEVAAPTQEGSEGMRIVVGSDGQPAIASTSAPSVVTHPGVESITDLGHGLAAVRATLGADELRALDGVVAVSDDVGLTTLAAAGDRLEEADSYEVLQWALENTGQKVSGPAGTIDADIDAATAWPVSTGAGVVVAVVDTGIDADHPDLAGALWVNEDEICDNGEDDDLNGFVDDCQGWDFVNDDPSVDDTAGSEQHDHGTHIASVIAARRDGVGVTGVAPDATIMALKVIARESFWMSDAVRAINYAIDNGAQVINLSWGSTPSTAQGDVAALEAAVDRAEAAGIVVVAAAGNENIDLDTTPVQPASLPNPGLITVAASTNQDEKAAFSAFGPATVDIFAPGHQVAGAVTEGWAYLGGSSVAAAHVSGAAALLGQQNPGLAPETVKLALVQAADLVPALEGLGRQPARLNVGNLFTDRPAAMVSFGGFDALQAEVAGTVTVDVSRTSGAPDAELALRGTLLATIDGVVHGVIGHPISVAGSSSSTDENAQARLGVLPAGASQHSVELAFALPAGGFALLVDVVDEGSSSAVQAPVAVFFDVRELEDGSTPDGDGERDNGAGRESGETGASEIEAPTNIDRPAELPFRDEAGQRPAEPTPGPAPSTTVGEARPGMERPADDPVSAPYEDQDESGGDGDGPGNGHGPADGPDGEGVGAPGSPEPGATGTIPTGPVASDGGEDDSRGDESGGEDAAQQTVAAERDGAGDTSASFEVKTLAPSSGPSTGGTVVTISGRGLPDRASVRFGDAMVAPVSVAPDHLIVRTRAHSPGVVDVAVLSPEGEVVVLPSGFTFVGGGAGDDGTTRGRPDTPLPGTDQPGGQRPVAPGNSRTATGDLAPSDESDEPEHPTLSLSFGSPTDWSGLRVAPAQGPADLVGALEVAAAGQRCATPVCVGVALPAN